MTNLELNGENLIKGAGLTKTDFAEKMGIAKQNVNALLKTKNIDILRKAANVLGVSFKYITKEVNPTAKREKFVFGYAVVDGAVHHFKSAEEFIKIYKSVI